MWKQRTLSIKGKITIVNTLALSPLISTSSLIGTPPENLKETNDIIQNYMWEGKAAKIAQNKLIKNIEQGGLKLCHFPTKVKALKLSWVKRLCDTSDAHWKILLKYFYNCDNLNLYFTANHIPLRNSENIPTFYMNIHELYMEKKRKKNYSPTDTRTISMA